MEKLQSKKCGFNQSACSYAMLLIQNRIQACANKCWHSFKPYSCLHLRLYCRPPVATYCFNLLTTPNLASITPNLQSFRLLASQFHMFKILCIFRAFHICTVPATATYQAASALSVPPPALGAAVRPPTIPPSAWPPACYCHCHHHCHHCFHHHSCCCYRC